jgi:hypothetical protein
MSTTETIKVATNNSAMLPYDLDRILKERALMPVVYAIRAVPCSAQDGGGTL